MFIYIYIIIVPRILNDVKCVFRKYFPSKTARDIDLVICAWKLAVRRGVECINKYSTIVADRVDILCS